MKYRLSKAAKEQYYSTIYKPITEKLEETIEPLKQLKELSEEQSKRMLPAPPVPPAIVPPPVPPAIEEPEEPIVEEVDEEGDEFVDVPEQATGVEEDGAVGGEEEEDKDFNDKGLDMEVIRKHGFQPPLDLKGLGESVLTMDIHKIGRAKSSIAFEVNSLKKEIETLQDSTQESYMGHEKMNERVRFKKKRPKLKN